MASPDSTALASAAQGKSSGLLRVWDEGVASPKVALLAIAALATVLRLLFLTKSFWEAEGESIAIVHGNQASGSWSAFGSVLWAREFNMALYYALLRFWLHLGNSEFFIRLLSVIPGVAAVVVIYLLGARLFDRRIALTAALLLAIHGSHLAYSQEARSYALLVFLCALSYLFFIRAIESSSAKYWLLYAIFSPLAVYAHFFAFLIFPAQMVSLLWLPRKEIPWKPLLASAAAIGLFATPAIVFILTKNVGQLSEIHSTWGRVPNLISEFAGTGAAVPVYVVLWGFAICAWSRSRMITIQSQPAWHRALVLGWLALPVFITLLGCIAKPILETRYLLFCVIPSVLVAAWGLFEISRRKRALVVVITIVLSLVGVVYTYAKPKDDWRGASEYVLSQAQSGDFVTVVPPASRWTFDYYLNRRPVPGLTYNFPQAGDIETWANRIPARSRVWVIYHDKGRLPSAAVANRLYSELTEALGRGFHLQSQTRFNMGSVELYEANSGQ